MDAVLLGEVIGGLIVAVLVAAGRYQAAQARSRAHAGKLYLGLWVLVTTAFTIIGMTVRKRGFFEVVPRAALVALFVAFGAWVFFVGFTYRVNLPDDETQETTPNPFGP